MSVPDEAKRKPPVTDLKDAVEGSRLISVISQLTVRFLFVWSDEFHEESSEIHHHHAYIALLTGLLATEPFPSGELKEPTAAQCDEIWQRLAG